MADKLSDPPAKNFSQNLVRSHSLLSFPIPPFSSLPKNPAGGMGSAVSSPSGVRDRVPADNAFLGILGTEIAAGDNAFPSL